MSRRADFWASIFAQIRDWRRRSKAKASSTTSCSKATRRAVNLMQSQAGRHSTIQNAGKLSDMRTGGWMVDKRLEDMDRDGIDKAVCFGGGRWARQSRALSRQLRCLQPLAVRTSARIRNGRMFACAYLTTIDVNETIAGMRAAKKRATLR